MPLYLCYRFSMPLYLSDERMSVISFYKNEPQRSRSTSTKEEICKAMNTTFSESSLFNKKKEQGNGNEEMAKNVTRWFNVHFFLRITAKSSKMKMNLNCDHLSWNTHALRCAYLVRNCVLSQLQKMATKTATLHHMSCFEAQNERKKRANKIMRVCSIFLRQAEEKTMNKD